MEKTSGTILSVCFENKETIAALSAAILTSTIAGLVYLIRLPFDRKSKRLQKAADLIEDIVNDANMYFLATNAENGIMTNILTKVNRLANVISKELNKDHSVSKIWTDFRRLVANEDGLKSRSQKVCRTQVELTRRHADDLIRALKINS